MHWVCGCGLIEGLHVMGLYMWVCTGPSCSGYYTAKGLNAVGLWELLGWSSRSGCGHYRGLHAVGLWVLKGPSRCGFVGLFGFVEDLKGLVNDLSCLSCLLHRAHPHSVVTSLDLKQIIIPWCSNSLFESE